MWENNNIRRVQGLLNELWFRIFTNTEGIMLLKFIDFAGRYQAVSTVLQSEFVKFILSPMSYAGMTAAAGYFAGVPIMWILMSSALAFASVLTGILRMNDIAFQNAVESKLRFGSLNFGISNTTDCDKKQMPTGKPYLGTIRVGLSVNSIAHFPIAIIVDTVSTKLDGQYAKEKAENLPAIQLFVASGGNAFINDVPVPVDRTKAIKGMELLEGIFEYKIRYGKSYAKCTHVLEGKFKINVYVNPRPQLPICEFYNV
jgi:hypothetical protein